MAEPFDSIVAGTCASTAMRLNWGCGSHIRPQWINCDVKELPGVDITADIRDGLPFGSNSFDYAVSIHALPELAYPEVVPALEELKRTLKPGGVLRLGLPDLRRGIRAYILERESYFNVDEEEVRSLGGRFIVHMLWYGYSRTLFTTDFVQELLEKAGFVDIVECRCGQTASDFLDIVELDNRADESFFVEACKPPTVELGEPYNSSVSKRTTVEVVESTTPEDGRPALAGGRATAVSDDHDESVTIHGWVLGRNSRVSTVEVINGSDVIARTEVGRDRPDIAERFPDRQDARGSGFRVTIRPEGRGESVLLARAVLEDGTTAPIEAIRLRVSRQGLFGRLRR